MQNLKWKKLFDSPEFIQYDNYLGHDLGASYSKESTAFKVWAPTAERVNLNLYTTGSDGEENAMTIQSIPMEASDQGIFYKKVKGDLHTTYYTYTVCIQGQETETGDIYAAACGVNGQRSMVVDMDRTNPQGWTEDKHIFYPLEQTQIWEVHIGDFSNDPASGVKEEYRGKYLGFAQKNTTLNNDGIHPTCLSYLKDLGVTHVHLLPAFDFGSVEEGESQTFNWGYDPINYNIPEGSYSTNPYKGEVRIREFKEMVEALHSIGISVVMDVVYNHTHSLDSHFNRTVPCYYYRQWEDGSFSDGSACGNDTASDRPMFRSYMIQSILFWVTQYHIDGFRFDLMGLHDTETMNEIRRALNRLPDGDKILMYGEPWSAGKSPLKKGYHFATKESMLYLEEGIAVFNDDTRDAVKGPYDQLEIPGYVSQAPDLEDKIKRAVIGLFDEKEKVQPASPAQVLNYVSAHDNSTLWDKLVDSVNKDKNYKNKDETIVAMNKLSAAIVQMSMGIPFRQAGEEAGRTKQGEDNSYCSSKQINYLDWNRMYQFTDLIQYYKGLQEVRKCFSGFYSLDKTGRKQRQFYTNLPRQVVAYKIKITGNNQEWNQAIVVFNASKKTITIPLKEGIWTILADDKQAGTKGNRKIKNTLQVNPISAAVIVCK